MNINNFELHIDEKILARGKKYFANGLVSDLWSEKPNSYCAVVNGSSKYDIEISLTAAGKVLTHHCDCPYDFGEYCKHTVAVLFAIREHITHGTELKKQGQKQGLHALLSHQSKKDLVELIRFLADEFGLREDVMCYFEERY